MPEKIVQVNEDVIKGQIKELVRGEFENVAILVAVAVNESGC